MESRLYVLTNIIFVELISETDNNIDLKKFKGGGQNGIGEK